ncbi:MAG: outer membrane beta-barrel protein [Bacteroidales bacterium]
MSDKIDFKAVNEGGADELMRSTMAGHRVEPTPGLWKGISRRLLWKELLHFNFTNLSPKYWMAGTAGLLVVVTAIYFGYPGGLTEHSSVNQMVSATPASFTGEKTAGLKQQAAPNAKPAISIKAANEAAEVQDLASSHLQSTGSPVKSVPYAAIPVSGSRHSSSPAIASEVNPQQIYAVPPEPLAGQLDEIVSVEGLTRVNPYETPLLAVSPPPDTLISVNTANGIVKFRKSSREVNQFFSVNAGLTPELAFYNSSGTAANLDLWLNGGFTYHISRFSLSTGLGFGYVYDQGKYMVEYRSRDSVGYFNNVTSYTVGQNNEIIYNTQTTNVYDSLQHVANSQTKNRYSYIQVPLLLGYRFYESKRVSLTLQAGPAISVLLGSRKPVPVIDYRNARIISVGNETPSRIQTNWQVWATLYFEMRLTRKISFYLEPSFKYFLKPVVTQENVVFKAPMTAGLGIGIQFNFGQKKSTP